MKFMKPKCTSIPVILGRRVVLFAICFMAVRVAQGQNQYVSGNEFWGGETNGLKAGLFVQHLAGATNLVRVFCSPILMNSYTNNGNISPDHLRIWLPPFESCFQMTLWNDKGIEVVKTLRGKHLGSPIKEPLYIKDGVNFRGGYKGVILLPNEPAQTMDDFKLGDFFEIKTPGKYRLKLEMRVIWITKPWNPDLRKAPPEAVIILPVEADIELGNHEVDASK